jgi:hypothetical protein
MARITRQTADQATKTAYVDRTRLAATTDEDIERQMAKDGEDPGVIHGDWHPPRPHRFGGS